MDLPEHTPAGGQDASDADDRLSAGDISSDAPVVSGVDAASAPVAGLHPEIIRGRRRKRVIPNVGQTVLSWTRMPSGRNANSSPSDAQGRTHMKTRTTLSSIAAIAGAGVLSLGLHACGQKPAPAEEAEAAAAQGGSGQAMRVTRVELRDLADDVVAMGRLVVREEAAVGSELPGYRVSRVYVDEGDWVKQGQAMAQLDDTLLQAQIAQAEATLATQKATVEFRRSQLERAESLSKEGAVSRAQLDQSRMEAATSEASLLASQANVNEMKVRQSRMTLRAPVAGAVLERAIRPGDISGGSVTPYFRIARDGLIELDAELADAKLAQIKIGDPVSVTLTTGGQLQGKVRFISPRVDAASGLGRARIELPRDASLRPGSFAEASFNGGADGVLTVPASAIRYEAGGPAVMVVDASNKVNHMTVKLGERMGEYVQIVQGPPAGSRVLATGSAFTLDGDVITPVEEGAQPAPAATQGN
jgi:HlyD family secretion protein